MSKNTRGLEQIEFKLGSVPSAEMKDSNSLKQKTPILV